MAQRDRLTHPVAVGADRPRHFLAQQLLHGIAIAAGVQMKHRQRLVRRHPQKCAARFSTTFLAGTFWMNSLACRYGERRTKHNANIRKTYESYKQSIRPRRKPPPTRGLRYPREFSTHSLPTPNSPHASPHFLSRAAKTTVAGCPGLSIPTGQYAWDTVLFPNIYKKIEIL